MIIWDDYSVTKLFASKDINIFFKEEEDLYRKQIIFHARAVRDMFSDDAWLMTYQLLAGNSFREKFKDIIQKELSNLGFLKILIFDLGSYDVFRPYYQAVTKELPIIWPGFTIDNQKKELLIDSYTITEDICDYLIYLLKLSYGERVEKPLTFEDEEAKQFYLAQKELEAKTSKIRAKGNNINGDSESLAKTILSITYAFPSLTIDYLYNQTMAQIQWLAKYAAKSVSYEVNAKAFAAGNMKKGKKLDFFIK